jgi:hypothetical protein
LRGFPQLLRRLQPLNRRAEEQKREGEDPSIPALSLIPTHALTGSSAAENRGNLMQGMRLPLFLAHLVPM